MSPANLNDPFGPSCCEAGGEPGKESAQPCGCDMGHKPPHFCEQHRKKRIAYPFPDGDGEVYDRFAELQAQFNSQTEELAALKIAVRKLISLGQGVEPPPEYYVQLSKVEELL